jgi:hypothetical protein
MFLIGVIADYCTTQLYKYIVQDSAVTVKYLRLSNEGGQAKFVENLHASPFNKNLLNIPTFSQIHLAGQYLLVLYKSQSRQSAKRFSPAYLE